MNSVGPRKYLAKKITKALDSEQLIVTTELGVRLTAEFDKADPKTRVSKNAELVILLHGWEGSASRPTKLLQLTIFSSKALTCCDLICEIMEKAIT